MGQLLNVGFEKIILLKNNANAQTAEVISSFVYQRGILEANYSYSTAVGLFNSIISFVLVIGSNKISRMTTEYSLW
jgi:putative aldouronate transport system permease protein